MKPLLTQQTDNPTWWTDSDFVASPLRPAFSLTLATEGEQEPSDEYIDAVLERLAMLDRLVLAASALIVENYSYEHFKALGVDDSLLLTDESPEGMSGIVTLTAAVFEDAECNNFELSFAVPWDSEHSFDVTFEDGEASYCAVNG